MTAVLVGLVVITIGIALVSYVVFVAGLTIGLVGLAGLFIKP